MVRPDAVRVVWVALAATCGVVAYAQAPPPPPVTFGLAVMHTGEDRYVDDLTAAEIRVVEDGRPQTVSALRTVRRPVSVCVVFDASSGDDQPAKHRMADAAIRALSQSLDPKDEVAVLEMLTVPSVRLPFTPASDVSTVSWSDARQRDWGLGDTMLAALDVLDRARNPRRVVLLLTDGLGGGRQVALSNLVTTRFRSETTVHAIEMVIGMPPDFGRGYMPVRDRRIVKPQFFDSPVGTREPDPALERVVVEGGGLRQQIGAAADVEQAVKHLVADLAFEFTVEYTPTSAEDGRFRRVTVETTRRDARVRHRAGYLASSPGVRTTTTVALPPVQSARPAAALPAAPDAAPSTRKPSPDPRASLRTTYEAAVESFRTTRAFTGAAVLVGRWSREMLSDAVAAARSSDRAFAYAAAVFHLEVALDVAPRSDGNARYHLDLAEQLLDGLPPPEKDDAAREFLDRWYAAAASVFLAQTDGQQAREIARRGVSRVPGSSRAQFVVGRVEELVALDLDVYNARLDPARKRARLAEAARVYREVLALEPGYTKTRLHLGRVLLMLDQRDEGRRLLETIANGVAHDAGDRYLAMLFLAADYERAGEFEQARATLEGVDAVAPGRQTGWLALAQLEQRAGRIERAREVVAAHLGAASRADEWWTYRNGGLQTEDLAWLRERLSR
jgi:VWFA-related protein